VNQKKPRLLFDECFGRPYVERMAQLVSYNPYREVEVRHFFEVFESGTPDEEWVPELAKQDFILISCDRGKKKTKGRPLPPLCVEFGIRHILLTRGFEGQKMSDKVLAILSVWHELLAIADEPKGVRYNLEVLQSGTRGKGRLSRKTPLAIAEDKKQHALPFSDEVAE